MKNHRIITERNGVVKNDRKKTERNERVMKVTIRTEGNRGVKMTGYGLRETCE